MGCGESWLGLSISRPMLYALKLGMTRHSWGGSKMHERVLSL